MRVGLLSGQPAVTIRHGFDLLAEIKNSSNQVWMSTLPIGSGDRLWLCLFDQMRIWAWQQQGSQPFCHTLLGVFLFVCFLSKSLYDWRKENRGDHPDQTIWNKESGFISVLFLPDRPALTVSDKHPRSKFSSFVLFTSGSRIRRSSNIIGRSALWAALSWCYPWTCCLEPLEHWQESQLVVLRCFTSRGTVSIHHSNTPPVLLEGQLQNQQQWPNNRWTSMAQGRFYFEECSRQRVAE